LPENCSEAAGSNRTVVAGPKERMKNLIAASAIYRVRHEKRSENDKKK
jgi:hypothetical protein